MNFRFLAYPIRPTMFIRRFVWVGSAAILTLLLMTFAFFVYRAPATFTQSKIVTVEKGEALTHVAESLEREGIIRSAFWLRNIVVLFGGEHAVQAGDYYFERKENLGGIAKMLILGDYGLDPLRVTIPEGASVRDTAAIFAERLDEFNEEEFIRIAESREGYLFPDTYFFLPNATERQVLEIMHETFLSRIQEISDEILVFGRSVDEVVTMASILEREANTKEARRTIAGILWKRIELGMPLQVDAAFDYVNGKNTFELTLDDLDIDSPYNTYRNIGLPPGPIANPGLDAILAAVTPIETEYLYFLADKNGMVHYSETFDEHKMKKARYLQ